MMEDFANGCTTASPDWAGATLDSLVETIEKFKAERQASDKEVHDACQKVVCPRCGWKVFYGKHPYLSTPERNSMLVCATIMAHLESQAEVVKDELADALRGVRIVTWPCMPSVGHAGGLVWPPTTWPDHQRHFRSTTCTRVQ